MKKTHSFRYLSLSFTGACALFFSSCAQDVTRSGYASEQNFNQLVCDPNDAKNQIDSTLGLRGKIYSVTSNPSSLTSSEQYLAQGTDLGVEMYLSKLHVPERLFGEGFIAADGTALTDNNGNRLVEYFALAFESSLKLSASDAEGKYQLAILSDDGATMRIDNGATVLIQNEGAHPTRMGCASQTIELKRDTRIPFKLSYFQGPKNHIALTLMWRKLPANVSAQSENLCGVQGNNYFWNQNDSSAKQPYYDLLARGWKPIAAGNFELTSGYNKCAKPAL